MWKLRVIAITLGLTGSSISAAHASVIEPRSDQAQQGSGAAKLTQTEQHLIHGAEATGTLRVLVTMSNAAKQSAVVNALEQTNAEVLIRYEAFPILLVEADAAVMTGLASDPRVTGLQQDVADPPTLASTIPLINANDMHGLGHHGTGSAVAILDTGIDVDHPFFAGRIVSQACYSNAGGNGTGVTLCPNGTSSQTTGSAADAETAACINAGTNICRHGSHVAGIAGGDATGSTPGAPGDGVAPDADIVSIQVFTRFNAAANCSPDPAPCVQTYASDQILGLQRVANLAGTNPIVSANMSLGRGNHSSNCDVAEASRKAAIDTLVGMNIATVISAGNDGHLNAVGAPGCISTAVTVGSTTDADAVASTSNRGPLLDLFAPGVSVNSSVPDDIYATFSGTSMAAPHVAGAWAMLREAFPTDSVADLVTRLQTTGVPITYSNGTTNVTTPRIDLLAAFQAGSSGERIIFEHEISVTGNDEIYSMNADGSDVVNLTNNASEDLYPVLSPDGTKIAFATNRDGNYNIYLMNVDGSNPTQFTANTATDEYPAWSPNGQQLAWVSNRDGDPEIFKVNVNKTGQVQLTNNTAVDRRPAWSADGTKIVFDSDRDGVDYEIFTMSATGANVTNLTNNTTNDAYATWSPDNTKIAFGSNRDGDYEIFTMPATGGAAAQLTTNSSIDRFPTWSPDGTMIAFDSNRDGDYEIYKMAAGGGSATQLTTNSPDADLHASWGGSAAGERIIFEHEISVTGNDEIYSMNADGSDVVNLTNNASEDLYPVLSPDGTKIAFATNRDGNYNIYLMNVDGSNPTQFTANTATDEYPAWSPNGQQLAWVSNRDGDPEIFKVNVNKTGQVQLTNNTAVDRRPAWSADGTKIVFDSDRDGVDYEIFTMSATGANVTNLTNNTTNDAYATWSPDNTKIAFGSNRDGDYEIFTMPATGGAAAQLTTNSSIDRFPTWSPDGTMIAFDSNRDGDYEIYKMAAGGGSATQLTTNSPDADLHASWGG